ncbi:MAG: DEAD/DEAH box helicase [Firmicutes bacterium]|uniref:DNA 3'-5' helicase n=1 Tax=Sulfobacillus benefaciens TaxID=453960 RepID=A0A2T2X6I6_9FIRM|nr:DEAD/DEAH box helicase [Bacillota bacterium]PSR30085.1 MAG: helicase [Sulfobacillus benefaciens]
MDRLPLIVQSDRTLLLEVDNPLFDEARDSLVGFAELVKSPEHVHTYRISSLSLWNAVASGLTPTDMLSRLSRYAQYPIPHEVAAFIDDQGRRYGKLRLELAPDGHGLWLTGPDSLLLTQMKNHKAVEPFLGEILEPGYRIDPSHRGLLKQALAKAGWPADDRAGYTPGLPLSLQLKDRDRRGRPFQLRAYQHDAVRTFWGDGSVDRGSGVIVLPCGAGKTLVGLGAMQKVQAHTLILTTSLASLHQWRDELLDKTSLSAQDIGEYSARTKSVKPVTLTTYQLLSHRLKGEYVHFNQLDSHDWGLIIYDEVHLLPAPVFRLTASLQARRRLGLTATLIREDGRADDVFSLIGPKRFDMAWKDLEQQGWIAQASCREIRVSLPDSWRERYATAEDTDRARIAASNPAKIGTIQELLAEHEGDHILIIGQYLDQLEEIRKRLRAPIITGQTPPPEREKLYQRFREGDIPVLIVSKVANFAIDLPDANVAIQVSGAFGSRQEEAQRLGRILRPKSNGGSATFYTIVSEDTKEQDFAQKRQLFLCEQGYRYDIAHADETGSPREVSRQVIQFPGGYDL